MDGYDSTYQLLQGRSFLLCHPYLYSGLFVLLGARGRPPSDLALPTRAQLFLFASDGYDSCATQAAGPTSAWVE